MPIPPANSWSIHKSPESVVAEDHYREFLQCSTCCKVPKKESNQSILLQIKQLINVLNNTIDKQQL